jgi:hypothetical protein
VLFGLIAFVRSGAGALAVITLIAIYAISVGALLIALAFRMHNTGKRPEKPASSEKNTRQTGLERRTP